MNMFAYIDPNALSVLCIVSKPTQITISPFVLQFFKRCAFVRVCVLFEQYTKVFKHQYMSKSEENVLQKPQQTSWSHLTAKTLEPLCWDVAEWKRN